MTDIGFAGPCFAIIPVIIYTLRWMGGSEAEVPMMEVMYQNTKGVVIMGLTRGEKDLFKKHGLTIW